MPSIELSMGTINCSLAGIGFDRIFVDLSEGIYFFKQVLNRPRGWQCMVELTCSISYCIQGIPEVVSSYYGCREFTEFIHIYSLDCFYCHSMNSNLGYNTAKFDAIQ